jgi:hypothetical protein
MSSVENDRNTSDDIRSNNDDAASASKYLLDSICIPDLSKPYLKNSKCDLPNNLNLSALELIDSAMGGAGAGMNSHKAGHGDGSLADIVNNNERALRDSRSEYERSSSAAEIKAPQHPHTTGDLSRGAAETIKSIAEQITHGAKDVVPSPGKIGDGASKHKR